MITHKDIERYRNPHCEHCHGEGAFYFTDWVPRPFGPGNVPMESSEVCECVVGGMEAKEEVFKSLKSLVEHYDLSKDAVELILEEFVDTESREGVAK